MNINDKMVKKSYAFKNEQVLTISNGSHKLHKRILEKLGGQQVR